MISKQDYLKYLQQVLDIEIQMERTYGLMVKDLVRDKYKNVFQALVKAEQDHQVKVRDIMKYFEDKE